MNEFNYSGSELDLFAKAENWKNYWYSLVNRHLKKNVLEVGAGIGTNTVFLNRSRTGLEAKQYHWLCIEPDKNLCHQINKKINAGLLPSEIVVKSIFPNDLELDWKFDTILYIDVLEHIENDKAELEHIAKYLNHQGKIVVVSPAHDFLFSPFDKKIGHFRRYNKASIKKIVPKNMNLIELKYLDSIGFFASLANKLVLRTDEPGIKQVLLWDRYMVPVSVRIDALLRHKAGKSIIAVMQKEA